MAYVLYRLQYVCYKVCFLGSAALLEFCLPRPRSAFVFRFRRIHKACRNCLRPDVVAMGMVDPQLGSARPACVCVFIVTMVDP